MSQDPITVEIWSDIACPWCYIGKRRFEAGLAEFLAGPDRPPVLVEYRSFELAPEVPAGFTGDTVDYLVARKGMSEDDVRAMIAHITSVAAGEGLEYDFDRVQPTNTRDALRLLHMARDAGLQQEMKERLLHAHFIEGRHMGDHDTLAELAGEVGLDADEVRASLAGPAWDAAVGADLRQAAQYGIGGVPFYVIDGRFGISGAQSPQTFTAALEQALAERVAAG